MKRLASALLIVVCGCAVVPASSQDDRPYTTATTIDAEGNVVEIPAVVDRAFKFEIVPIEE